MVSSFDSYANFFKFRRVSYLKTTLFVTDLTLISEKQSNRPNSKYRISLLERRYGTGVAPIDSQDQGAKVVSRLEGRKRERF